MINSSATVSAELGLTLVVPDHGSVPLVASLYYSADDPYAIRMAFHVGLDEPVEWIFARELLETGIAQPTGEGDVQVWPGSPDGRDVLNLSLSARRISRRRPARQRISCAAPTGLSRPAGKTSSSTSTAS